MTLKMVFLLSIFLSLLPEVLAAPHIAARAECTRESLQAATASYIAAQTSGSASGITGLAASTNYTENFKVAAIGSGILSQALRVDHSRSYHDTTQCATYTELVVTDPKHPYVIGTQMWFGGADGAASRIDSLVTDKGDWLFNATGTLYWTSRESWAVIPEGKRDSREALKAGADAYLDIFKDKSVKVPWGTPCARLEGGMYTGKGVATDSCNVGIPNLTTGLINRRYVIDETVGAVDVFLDFEGHLPDSHEFRMEGGKLRYVHTITVMGG